MTITGSSGSPIARLLQANSAMHGADPDEGEGPCARPAGIAQVDGLERQHAGQRGDYPLGREPHLLAELADIRIAVERRPTRFGGHGSISR